jgi:hypothetical protein
MLMLMMLMMMMLQPVSQLTPLTLKKKATNLKEAHEEDGVVGFEAPNDPLPCTAHGRTVGRTERFAVPNGQLLRTKRPSRHDVAFD